MSSLQDAHSILINFEAVFNQLPIAISIYDHTGLMVASNDTNVAMWGMTREDAIGHFNMVTDPQLAAQGTTQLFDRVMRGETIIRDAHPMNIRDLNIPSSIDGVIWVEATYSPLRGPQGNVSHLLATLRNVTREVDQANAIALAQAEIINQRAIIETLSSPVVQIWQGILTMPLVGTIDSRRASTITENLLHAITDRRADCVILDITGVPIVDTQIAQHLISTATACRLLGCEVALVGIGVEMAQTLVQLGIELNALVTLADLQAGVAWAFARQKLRVTLIEPRLKPAAQA